jgi:Fe-S cluster assembly ATP-binding protein
MLEIKDLHVSVKQQAILNGINLTIKSGEIHALMGPNSSGKSTLANVLAGKPGYDVRGSIIFQGQDLLSLAPHQRALAGLFLAFQYPVAISGMATSQMLKAALNAHIKHQGGEEIDTMEFLTSIKDTMAQLNMPDTLLHRAFNEDFSGGEKKRNEILQLLTINPAFAILDEMDSGLDIDTLQVMAAAINHYHSANHSLLIITHYQRLLHHVVPDYVHILAQGKIIKSGNQDLALALEQQGYAGLIDAFDR